MDDFEPLNSSSLLLSYYEFILDGSDAELKAQLDDLLGRCGLASHIRPLRCVQPVKSADLSKLPYVRWTIRVSVWCSSGPRLGQVTLGKLL